MNCDNCGEEIVGSSVLSPTADKRRQQQCLKCAREWCTPMQEMTPKLKKMFDKATIVRGTKK